MMPVKPELVWLTQETWEAASLRERALLWASYFSDVVRPRETPLNSNRGEWVDRFLRGAGVSPGNPWCASFVAWCYKMAGMDFLPKNAASVYGWVHNGIKAGVTKQITNPTRGDLFYWLNADNHGHIGFIVKANILWIESIEGNAQPGEGGDQREGGGVYRRKRLRTKKIRFLRVNG